MSNFFVNLIKAKKSLHFTVKKKKFTKMQFRLFFVLQRIFVKDLDSGSIKFQKISLEVHVFQQV